MAAVRIVGDPSRLDQDQLEELACWRDYAQEGRLRRISWARVYQDQEGGIVLVLPEEEERYWCSTPKEALPGLLDSLLVVCIGPTKGLERALVSWLSQGAQEPFLGQYRLSQEYGVSVLRLAGLPGSFEDLLEQVQNFTPGIQGEAKRLYLGRALWLLSLGRQERNLWEVAEQRGEHSRTRILSYCTRPVLSVMYENEECYPILEARIYSREEGQELRRKAAQRSPAVYHTHISQIRGALLKGKKVSYQADNEGGVVWKGSGPEEGITLHCAFQGIVDDDELDRFLGLVREQGLSRAVLRVVTLGGIRPFEERSVLDSLESDFGDAEERRVIEVVQ